MNDFDIMLLGSGYSQASIYTAQKMKFSIKNLFSKCDQIHRKLRFGHIYWKKSLMENISCAVLLFQSQQCKHQGIVWNLFKIEDENQNEAMAWYTNTCSKLD